MHDIVVMSLEDIVPISVNYLTYLHGIYFVVVTLRYVTLLYFLLCVNLAGRCPPNTPSFACWA